ncbi:MAG: hypothetical protein ACPG1C_11050 [Alphaproteobacteria bacterium]
MRTVSRVKPTNTGMMHIKPIYDTIITDRGNALMTLRIGATILILYALTGCAPIQHPTYFAYDAGLPDKWGGISIMLREDPRFVPYTDSKPDAHVGEITIGGDVVRYYGDCREDPDYVCLFDNFAIFALPRKMNDATSGWWYADKLDNEYEFTVKERDVSVQMFGNRFENLYRIAVPPAHTWRGKKYGEVFEFLYSPNAGVVAFAYIPPPESDRRSLTYWSTEALGFGTQQRAAQRSPEFPVLK